MTQFAPIAFLDTFDLVASMPPYLGMFGAAVAGERVLPLRGQRKDIETEERFGWYKPYGRWVEMKNMLGQLKRIGDAQLGEIELGRVFLEMIDPGAATPWRNDDTAFIRAHLPLRTNPAAMMYVGGETRHLFPGQLTIISVAAKHSWANFGEWPRVHLVVDFRRKRRAENDT